VIVHDVEQGSLDWLKLRLGIPTASEFSKIITPSKGDLSKSARKYAHYLVAESLMGEPLESLDHLEWIARGKELEPQAVQNYEFTYDVETQAIGFVTTDDGRMGASPDRFIIGSKAGLEIKCPSPQVHVGYLIDGPGEDYKPQVQGQLLIAELEYVDFFSYHPRCPPVRIRTYRDELYLVKMQAALELFCEMKDEMMQKARSSGFFDERANMITPIDLLAEDLS